MFFRQVKEMAVQECVTEALKTEDQMLWVQRSNSISKSAREVVNQELIFV